MKGKNIRKEKPKKSVRRPVDYSINTDLTDADYGVDYCVHHDNYEAEVRLKGTNELVGVYRAAARDWRVIHLDNYLTHDIRAKVESLYA